MSWLPWWWRRREEGVAPMATDSVRTFVKVRLSAGLRERIDGLVEGGKGRPHSGLGGLGKLGWSEFWLVDFLREGNGSGLSN